MTPSEADTLMAAIAELAEVVGPYRTGCAEACENPEEIAEARSGFEALVRELVTAVRAIETQQPEVVARRRRRG